MTQQQILKETEVFVKETLERDGTGHDWWHIERVLRTAIHIGKKEKANLFIVKLGALLHDIADHKFHGGDGKKGGRVAREWLERLTLPKHDVAAVCHIVDNVSFKGNAVKSSMKSIEGKIVQDADRLDALGAIGIARAFAYGGFRERPLYNPKGKTKTHRSFAAYKKGSDSTVHHFYEKLLHLKNAMNTKTGKSLARKRHVVMKRYLQEFFREWKGIA